MRNTVSAFSAAFRSIGYEPCADGSIEEGIEKVAIYRLPTGQVRHMARQLSTGLWTSKIGGLEDIEHATPAELEGIEYGIVVQYLRRAIKPKPSSRESPDRLTAEL